MTYFYFWFQKLTQLQEEIDTVTNERMAWGKEESNVAVSQASKLIFGSKVIKCEEKVQALALLMLHFCAGLQHVQDLEESAKEFPAPNLNSEQEFESGSSNNDNDELSVPEFTSGPVGTSATASQPHTRPELREKSNSPENKPKST